MSAPAPTASREDPSSAPIYHEISPALVSTSVKTAYTKVKSKISHFFKCM